MSILSVTAESPGWPWWFEAQILVSALSGTSQSVCVGERPENMHFKTGFSSKSVGYLILMPSCPKLTLFLFYVVLSAYWNMAQH